MDKDVHEINARRVVPGTYNVEYVYHDKSVVFSLHAL